MKKIRLKTATRRVLRNLPIFVVVFCVLFSSLFLWGIGPCFEEFITGKMDIFLYLQPGMLSTYEDKEKFLNLNASFPKNVYAYEDVEQTELYVFKCCNDKSVTSLINEYGSTISLNDEGLDKLFEDFCYGFMKDNRFSYIGQNSVELHRNGDFVWRYPYLTLSAGRTFTEEELSAGEKVCLIGEDYAQIIKTENGYSIKECEPGDTIYLTKVARNSDNSIADVFTFSLTVIGTVKQTYGATDYSDNVFMPEKTMELILKEHGHEDIYSDRYSTDHNFMVGMIGVYKLSSLTQLEKLKRQIDKHKSDSWTYYTNLEKAGYSGMADMVISISNSFKIISCVLMVLIVLVSAALIILEMNSRRNEIGLLKSMGKEDKDIIKENSATRIMTYMISALIGYFGAVKLSRTVMEYQFSKGGSDGEKLLKMGDKLLKLNNAGLIISAVFIIILCFESVVLYRYLISRITVKELLEKQE